MASTSHHDDVATDVEPSGGDATGPVTSPPPAALDAPASEPVSSGPRAAPPSPGPTNARSAASTTYVGVGVGLVVLVVVLIFVIQNLHDTTVHFFTAEFSLPIGVVILAAVVAGGILVLVASAARVLQLRANARRHRKAHEAASRR